MASLKPVIRPDKEDSSGKSKIYIRLSHARKTRYIKTPYVIDARHMGADGMVKSSYAVNTSLNIALLNLVTKYSRMIISIGDAVDNMGMEDLLKRLRGDSGGDFIHYAMGRIEMLVSTGRISLAESFRLTADHLKRFSRKEEVLFREISPVFLEGFEQFLRKRNCKVNTIGVYMRNIRSIFNSAIDEGEAMQELYPFRRYRIRSETTVKRWLSVEHIRRMYLYRHECDEIAARHAWAIDIFLLSFCLIGINLKDLLYLERSKRINGRIYYNRAKTSRQYSIKVVPEALEAIALHEGGKYLLNVIERKEAIAGKRKRQDLHKDVIGYFNRYLKEIAAELGINEKVSSYYARHSWATIASSLDISKDVISHALGHGNNTVTDVYIDFDLGKVDEANKRVVNTIFG
jgi:site-specific recombinase XerD